MDQKIRQGAALAAVAALALAAGPVPADATEEQERPWWERQRTRGNHRPRKGTKPKAKRWFLVQEVAPASVALRQAAGQRLERRADGIWIWPVADQRRYQKEHP